MGGKFKKWGFKFSNGQILRPSKLFFFQKQFEIDIEGCLISWYSTFGDDAEPVQCS